MLLGNPDQGPGLSKATRPYSKLFCDNAPCSTPSVFLKGIFVLLYISGVFG